MSGRFIPRVQFDFPAEDCKSSWVQIEPIFCVMGYGIKIKIILRQVSGTGDKKYEYDRTIQYKAQYVFAIYTEYIPPQRILCEIIRGIKRNHGI